VGVGSESAFVMIAAARGSNRDNRDANLEEYTRLGGPPPGGAGGVALGAPLPPDVVELAFLLPVPTLPHAQAPKKTKRKGGKKKKKKTRKQRNPK
jgi:hypothetical protein